MTDWNEKNLPELFGWLIELGCFTEEEICKTADGFYAVTKTMADLLACRGITTVPGSRGEQLECSLFFDDWYLYGVAGETGFTYSLFKMREQEQDAKLGKKADGDIPGVTVPFISLRTELLQECLQNPAPENRARLNEEINRVVAYKGQQHSEQLKQYFIRTEAQGPYLIAKLYAETIASLAKEGCIAVPERYADDYKKRGLRGRVPRFIEENNRNAGRVICDHEQIFVADPASPTEQERLAILATHTGNTSYFSFAAEVQFHARFLTRWAKVPFPVIGKSIYASAVRADLSIGDAEFAGPTPYYRPESAIVRQQYRCHKENVFWV